MVTYHQVSYSHGTLEAVWEEHVMGENIKSYKMTISQVVEPTLKLAFSPSTNF